MSKGWIKLHRSMFDNDLWTAEPFTKGQAWIDLIGHANHRPASIWIRGIEVSVERGQLAWSELTMADRWKWSRGKVRRYLRMLQDRGMVIQQTNKLTTVLTICKYDTYQTSGTSDETSCDTTGDTTDGQQTDNRRYTNKKNNNVENEEEVDIVISYLNDAAGKKFRGAKTDRSNIAQRIEDYGMDAVKSVIDKKCAKWRDDPKMRDYLRPSTLFRPSNFDAYLNEDSDGRPKTQPKSEIDELKELFRGG